jgi:hypothetical protein
MGRRRKDGDPLGLAGTRLVFSNGRFFYRHRGKPERWENVGTDIASAKKRAALYNDPQGVYGTVGYWLDRFVVDMQAMAKAGIRSQRTVDDYTGYCDDDGPLKAFFGRMLPEDITPNSVKTYLKEGADIIPGLEGEMVNIRESTALMSRARSASLIEYALAYCASNGVELSEPGPGE